MYNLSDINTVKNLLAQAGFTFKKSLGQNFLVDPDVCPDMAEACGCDRIGVLEIGPGVGVLTRELACHAKKVVAIELDERLRPVLQKTLREFDNITVLFGDAMKLDLHALIAEQFGDMPVVVCANLPYYITSPLVMMLLESRLPVDAITVMVQREAAERLTANVGTRESGAVTVAVSYYSESETLFSVMRDSFVPPPNVDSAVIKLCVRKNPPVKVLDEKKFFRFARAGFEQRRKTLQNSVSSVLNIPKTEISDTLESVGLPADVRAEKLTMDNIADIANALTEKGLL